VARVEANSFVFEDLRAGEWNVIVRAHGWVGSSRVTLSPAEGGRVTVTLDRAPLLRLALTNESTGRPVARRHVFVEGPVSAERVTDAEGVVTFDNLSRGVYDIHFGSEAADHFCIASRVSLEADRSLAIAVPLASIRGRIVAPEGATLFLGEYTTAERLQGPMRHFVSAEGLFEIDDLRVAPVWVQMTGYSGDEDLRGAQRVVLGPGTNYVTLVLERCGSVHVR
jgi:hypothetical protein